MSRLATSFPRRGFAVEAIDAIAVADDAAVVVVITS